jgi:hypothetical protein
MAEAITRQGEAELHLALAFPDAEAQQGFEAAFQGWLKEYEQRLAIQRALQAAAEAAESAPDDDTSGYLIELNVGKKTIYLNAMSSPFRVW